MNDHQANDLVLEDGANIAVVGGGPSGSFFTYFALDFAERFGLDINIDIIEAKDFTCAGSPGCNHCGGIISESLIQMLSTEGIVLPSKVIRRGIESYTMHVEQGTTVIDTPLHEQRIASVFRGFGPKGSVSEEFDSFDNHLLNLCIKKGANKIHDKVKQVTRTEKGVLIQTKKAFEKEYDLVVSAVGLNKQTYELFKNVCPSFVPPKTTRTYISEIYLDAEKIDEYFGNSMHVFLLDLPSIKFGALIPKGHYVTLVLLGSDINKDVVSGFLNSETVKKVFPPGTDISTLMPCQCFPYINVEGAKSAYSDRVIIIGDTSSSKLYKNGIGAAYLTAKAAAKTAIFDGISDKVFKKNYQPVCNDLDGDNQVGKFIFMATTIIQKSAIMKRGVLSMVRAEQKKPGEKRRMSSVLWDTFTGSAPYKDIFKRFINPRLNLVFIWHIVTNMFNTKQKEVS
jgi:flavin-dependent dehydrogenase